MANARKSARRGAAFVMAMISLVILMILGVSSINAAMHGARLGGRERAYAESLMMAEAGFDAAEAYLRSLTTPPTINSTTWYPTAFRESDFNAGTYTNMKAAPDGTGWFGGKIVANAGESSWTRNYIIIGYGVSKRDGIKRHVVGQVIPQNFSLYGYFEDLGLSNNHWVSGISKFDGPFHSNNGSSNTLIDWTRSATPEQRIFWGPVSLSRTAITWKCVGSSPNNPVTDADWGKIFVGGKSALSTGTDVIPFPTVANEQKAAAWGAASGFPTEAEVYLSSPVDQGGIYICSTEGTTTQPCGITFSLDAQSRQVITITHQIKPSTSWQSKTTEITANTAGNVTYRRTKLGTDAWSATETLNGIPNGVIYATGDITSLSGTIADNYVSGGRIVRSNMWTVSNDFSNTTAGKKKVTVTGDIRYQSTPDFTKPKTDISNITASAFGVITWQVLISKPWVSPAPVPDDLTMHGVYMGLGAESGGSIRVTDISSQRLRGNLYIMGGTIVKNAAILGQFNTSTQLTVYGFNERYSYDPRMADGPLHAFPWTNIYDVSTWQVL